MTAYSAGLAALATTLGIDVGLLHNIVHGPATGAGSTVTTEGGTVPTLAKAALDLTGAMATWSALAALTGAGSASDDLFIVYDVSAAALKAMTRAQLKIALIDQQLGFTPENAAMKGALSGYAGLDSGGRVPFAQLPASVATGMQYQGTWNATTNSPTLASGVGTQGNLYRVGTAGSTTIDGVSVWTVGDHIVFNGTIWEKWEGGLTNAEIVASLGYTPANKAGDTFTGDLLFTDATYDIGKTGATRPRDGFFSRNLVVGTDVAAPAFKTTATNVNAQTGTSYSLVDADNGKVVTLSNASAITLTVPSGLAAGFSCTLVQLGAGQVTITASSTTLRNRNGLKLAGQYAQAGLFYIAADTYSVGGDLST